MEETSEIAKYFADKSIFITGATGFLGKVLIEKLLRSCPEVKKIYVLVRHKKGNTPQQRIADILKCPLYDQVRKADPDFIDKLDPIEGDLLLPAMGISPEDEKKLIADVDIVFHSAATVRFDEPIKLAVKMNIIGTRKIIDLCKQMSHLESFVHVSTAYANCNRSIIDEEIYKPPINPNAITDFVESISDEIADQIAPMLIQPWPNTYTYTKAITETLVLEECVDRFPCAIVRPSIVGGSYREPFPGWIDNFNGPTAIFASVGKGLLRTMYGDKSCIADILPVDYSVNTMIVAAWATGTKKPKKIPVYNNTTGQLNRFTWGYMEELLTENAYENPLESIFIPPRGRFTMNRVTRKVRHVLEELVPAHLLDYYLHFSGKKKLFVRLLSRITRGARTLEYFTTHQWHFISSNIEHVEKEMNDTDRKIFYLNVRDIEWGIYIRNYYIGMKKYLLKEDMSKMNRCKKALKKSIMVQNVTLSILFILFILFIWYIFASFLRLTF